MKTFGIIIVASIFATAAAAAELSPGEIAWGKAARACLKTTAPDCRVTLKDDRLRMWCPSREDKYAKAIAKCDAEADKSRVPQEWVPPGEKKGDDD